jgi:hypothetical protein
MNEEPRSKEVKIEARNLLPSANYNALILLS